MRRGDEDDEVMKEAETGDVSHVIIVSCEPEIPGKPTNNILHQIISQWLLSS